MSLHVEGVDEVHAGGDAVPKTEIGGDGRELGGVASRQRQVEALLGELGRNRARDGRGATEDEDGRHQPPLTRPSRRASDEESTPRGSRRALIARNSSRRGYMARTASGVVVASLAR